MMGTQSVHNIYKMEHALHSQRDNHKILYNDVWPWPSFRIQNKIFVAKSGNPLDLRSLNDHAYRVRIFFSCSYNGADCNEHLLLVR